MQSDAAPARMIRVFFEKHIDRLYITVRDDALAKIV